MPANRALDAAIALARNPTLAAGMRCQPLPEDIKLLLGILAADADALTEARRITGFPQNELAPIIESYVLKVMLFRGASSRRVLGVESNAERHEIRRNLRYLLNWLHPDKNASIWHAAFARRVIVAWRSIDRGQDDGEPSGPTSKAHRSRYPQRLPWIVLPPPVNRQRHPVRSLRRFWLAGLVVISGCTLPDSVGLEIGRTVSAMAIYPSLSAR